MSPNDMVKLYNDEITIVSNSLAPQRSRTITMRSNSDWFTPQTRLQKQIKRQKERLWRKTKSTKERIDYIHQRKYVNKLICDTKINYYKAWCK